MQLRYGITFLLLKFLFYFYIQDNWKHRQGVPRKKSLFSSPRRWHIKNK